MEIRETRARLHALVSDSWAKGGKDDSEPQGNRENEVKAEDS